MSELTKIKKRILLLSQRTTDRGCTEAEMVEAMEKIGELLDVYNLELVDCMFADERCIQNKVHIRRRTKPHWVHIFTAIARMTQTNVWMSKPYINFFGFEPDVQMAVYLSNLMLDTLEHETRDFQRTNTSYRRSLLGGRRKLTRSFQIGFMRRLNERLASLPRPTGKGLVLTKQGRIDDEFKRQLSQLKLTMIPGRKTEVETDAYYAGKEAGNNFNLSRPLGQSSPSISGFIT